MLVTEESFLRRPLFSGRLLFCRRLSPPSAMIAGQRDECALLRYVNTGYRRAQGLPSACSSALRRGCSLLLCALVCWVSFRAARALDPRTPLDFYSRQVWSAENGLPQNSVHTMLQTSDGYLWLGTEAGLARFDGYQFRVFSRESSPALPEDDIRCLFEDSSGALWVGTASGLTRMSDGAVRTFAEPGGALDGAVRSVLQTDDGRLWVLTDKGLSVARVLGVDPATIAFRALAETDGLAGARVLSMAKDGRGDLWLGTSQGLNRVVGARIEKGPAALDGLAISALAADAAPQHAMLIASADRVLRLADGALTTLATANTLPVGGVRSLLATDDGVWVVGRSSLLLLKPQALLKSQAPLKPQAAVSFTAGASLPGTQITAIAKDHRGITWIGTNAGLARFVHGRMTSTDRGGDTVSTAVLSILEDRNGDLWTGTETAGVSVLRDRVFQPLPGSPDSPETPPSSVLQTSAGDLWIGTRGAGLTHIGPRQTRTFSTKTGLASDTVLALADGGASSSDIWAGTPDGLNRWHAGVWQLLTSADGLADDLVRSALVAHDGALWIGSRRGVTRWMDGRATTLTTVQGLGSDLVGPMLEVGDDLWVGTSRGLARIHNGAVRNFTVADGLPSDVISALQSRTGGGLWIGTLGHGLALWDGARLVSLAGVPTIPRIIHALLEDNAGSLWLTSDHGIFRMTIADLNRYLETRANDVEVVPYGIADGLSSVETAAAGFPSAWRLADGRLCFVTRRGVVQVDPSRSPLAVAPPPVVIDQITIDDRPTTRDQLASIPPGPSHFSFAFAGINFASPQRVQYRYTLEGVDPGWVDAGARRIAFYTNLPHGTHRFQVCARNAGGPWSQPAVLTLHLKPYAYQTLWFRLLLATLLLTLTVLAYRLRLRVLRGRFAAVTAERSRLAREIHDTLAQSFVAVSVRLEILSQLLGAAPGMEQTRAQLDQTRDLVRGGLAEARRSIWDLRSDGSGRQSLPTRLSSLVQQARSQIADATLETTGAYRALEPTIEDELFRIAQEGITNALRHANAGSLRVRLQYDVESLTLEILDDGQGFDPRRVPSRDQGHYGLTGLRERADLLGAELVLGRAAGGGTSLRIRVPLPLNLKQG